MKGNQTSLSLICDSRNQVAAMVSTTSTMAVAASVVTGVLLSLTGNANAEDFGFEFDTNYLLNDSPKGDIFLESIEIGDEIVQDFAFVAGVSIVENDPFLGGDTGAASADIGDTATTGIAVEDATANDILTNLSNNNLNNIIDTEDTGSFIIDLTFDKTIDNLLIWERGKNSSLGIQAVDFEGNLIGERRVIDRDMWFKTDFKINTTEIIGNQEVGALGINIAEDLGVDSGNVGTIRFFSESSFNGPDWKFIGTDSTRSASVPEPALVLGLGLLGGVFATQKRKCVA